MVEKGRRWSESILNFLSPESKTLQHSTPTSKNPTIVVTFSLIIDLATFHPPDQGYLQQWTNRVLSKAYF